ncbi:MAG: MFS transporter [Methanobacterium sp.]|uniref:MFS transporter n=1 Tax=Methanobacterium sp. TaxID=2164 RepID=UPI003C72FD54
MAVNDSAGEDGLNVGWFTLIIVTLALFIISIDITFLNVAITTLVHDLHTTIFTIQNIIVIYTLVLASLTLVSGELEKVLGRKKTFLIGSVIYGAGTLIAALSINSNMLLLGWSILEGIGGALMWVATTSIVIGSYTGKRRATALGLVASIASGAALVGPIIGGFLTTYYSWRYAFGLEFVIILVILMFSRAIPSFPKTMTWSKFNIIGALNSGLGIFLVVYGLILLNNPNTEYLSPYVILVGLILLIIFYFDQRSRLNKDKHALVDIRLFKVRAFLIGNIARFLLGLVTGGIRFIIPVFVQTVLGYSPITTGYTLVAMVIPMFLVTFTTGKVSVRFQPRYIISTGFILTLIGCIYLINVFRLHTGFIEIASGLALLGLGAGIISPHLSNLAFLCITQDKQPDASAIWNTNSNLNSSMGTAILGLILLMGTFNVLSVEKLVSGIINAFYVIIIILFLGLIITQFVQPKKS